MKNNIVLKLSFAITALITAPCALLAVPPPGNAPSDVPDSGSTALLFVISVLGFFAVRRFSAKAK